MHLSDVVLRFCITVSHLNRALYFACDNVLWAGKSGLAPRVDQEKWAQRSFRFDILLSYKTFCIPCTACLAFCERSFRVFLEYTRLNHLASGLHLDFKLSEDSEWRQMEGRFFLHDDA